MLQANSIRTLKLRKILLKFMLMDSGYCINHLSKFPSANRLQTIFPTVHFVLFKQGAGLIVDDYELEELYSLINAEYTRDLLWLETQKQALKEKGK